MDEYKKIYKKYVDGRFDISLKTISDSKNSGFRIQLNKWYQEGYSQIIINSELMMEIIQEALLDNWVLMFVKIDDPSVDEDMKNEIKKLIELIKEDKLYFTKFQDYLNWALEDGSIFIDHIRIAKKYDGDNIVSDVFSSGIFLGSGVDYSYNTFVKNIVNNYLNSKRV